MSLDLAASEAAKVSVPVVMKVNESKVLLTVPDVNTGLFKCASTFVVSGEQPKKASLLQEAVPRFKRLSLIEYCSWLKFN